MWIRYLHVLDSFDYRIGDFGYLSLSDIIVFIFCVFETVQYTIEINWLGRPITWQAISELSRQPFVRNAFNVACSIFFVCGPKEELCK